MTIRRFALVSGLAVLSAFAFVPKAGAVPATVDVNFNGTIAGACSFTGTTAGSLGQDQPGNDWVEASNGVNNIGTTGNAGSTTVNCTSGGTVSVASPVKLSAPSGFTDNLGYAVVYDSAASNGSVYTTAGTALNSGWPSAPSPLSIPANTNRTLKVGMLVGKNSSTGTLPAGTYSYKVTLTATPN